MSAKLRSPLWRPVSAGEEDNPWNVIREMFGYAGATATSRDRLDEIRRSTDLAWLKRVAAWRDNTPAIRAAAQRKIRAVTGKRKLDRQAQLL